MYADYSTFVAKTKLLSECAAGKDGAANDHIRSEMRTKYYVAPRVSTFTFTFWNDANCSPLPSQATPPPLIRTALRNKKVHQDYKRSVVR